MKIVIDNWQKELRLELEVMKDYRNVENNPNSLYARAILVEPKTNVRHYQKLITIHFTEEDKIS